MPTGQLVNLPAGAPLRPTGQPFNRSTNRSVICHRCSHPFRVAGGSPGWQVAALFHSALHSVLNAILHSVLRDRLTPPPLQVAGGSPGRPVAGVPPSVIDSALCHLSSTQSSISGGRWQLQVAGGGLFHSALHAVLNAVLHSALRDRFSHLSSVIDSVIHSVIHSALPEAARSARSADPTSSQCPEITKNDEPRTKNSPDQHPLCRDAVPTLPRQTRAARGAAPTQST